MFSVSEAVNSLWMRSASSRSLSSVRLLPWDCSSSLTSCSLTLMNVSDYAVMDTQELSIIGASALERNSGKRGSFHTVLCCQISVWCKKCLG